MAPNINEAAQAQQSTFNIFEELQKSFGSLHKEIEEYSSMVTYPTEDKVEETGEKVTVTLHLGDFKPDEIKVRIENDIKLVIEGILDINENHGHHFFRSLQLPYPCHETNIKTHFENELFTIVAIKDHDKAAQLEIEMKEEEQKIKDAIEKFTAMKADLKPIVFENVEEDDKYYNLKVNLGDYAKDELSIQFHGPHNMVIEAAKKGEIRRRFLRQIYFELPCKVDQDVLVLEETDENVIVKIAKDMKAIQEIEEFNGEMKHIQDFFDDQNADIETEDKDNEIQMKVRIKNFTPEEVKVTIDDALIIEANHEDAESGCKFSFYRTLQLPDEVAKDAIKHSIDQDGRLNIKIPKLLHQQG